MQKKMKVHKVNPNSSTEVVKTQENSKVIKSKVLRLIIFILGIIAFVLGTIGIPLPILPTAPLYLLAAFCFLKSSEKFHTWFLNSKLYKKHVQNFAETKSMIIVNEIILLVSVSALLMITTFFVKKDTVAIILACVLACKYFYFIIWVKPISRDEFKVMQAERAKKRKEEEAQKLKALESAIAEGGANNAR